MTDHILSAAGAPAALSAFVRGIERRAAVFAELLSGDAIAGDAALAAAIRAFRGISAATPLPERPRRFWGLLLASPQLRRTAPGPTRSSPLGVLSGMSQGPRAAVLMRLAGGLTDADAASALGIATATYRLALQRALPRGADGSADAETWRALAESIHGMVKSLPATRLAHLARIREAAVHGQPLLSSPSASRAVPAVGRPHWQRPALYTLAGLTIAALMATFFDWRPQVGPDGASHIRRAALPAAEAPASTFDARTALLSHRDFDLLIDAQGDALSRDLDFYAWLAAESAVRAATGEETATILQDSAALENRDARQ